MLAAVETFAGAVRITAVEAIPFAVPYRREPRFASGSVSRADNVLVRVHTDAGLVGQAEAQPRPYTYGETQASIVDAVARPAHRGADGRRPAAARTGRRAVREHGRQLRRARRGRSRRVGSRRADPQASVPHAAGRLRRRRGRGAHGLVRRAGGDGRGGASRSTSVLGSARSRSRSGAHRRSTSRPTRAIREALPDADLYVDANRGWSYDDARAGRRRARRTRRAGDRGADLGRGPRRAAAAGRALGGPAGRRRELHQPRARRPRARGGRGPGREHQDGAHGVHGVAADPRSLPGPQRAGGRRQPVRGSDRRARHDRVRRGVRRHRRPAGGDHELPRPRATISSSPGREIRDGRAAVPAAPGLGIEVDEDRLQRYRVDR